MQVHWTDQSSDNSDTIIVGDKQRDRKRIRIERVRLCNTIFQHFGLKLEDWNGSKYILRNQKGNAEIVHDLGSLWITAEKMLGYSINPLNSQLLAKLKNL